MPAGPITKLQRSFAYRLSRWFPSEFVRWIDAVSAVLDNISGATQAEERFVNTAGSDTTGDGSFDNPFQSVSAAMASITDADPITKPYTIFVAPGRYAGSFTIKNGVYVKGAGMGSGNYNGGPVTAATYLNPDTVQVLAADWAGAGEKSGGISNCAFSGGLQADFQSIAITGNGSFIVEDCISDSDVIFIGATANASCWATVKGLILNAVGADLKMINMGGSDVTGTVNDFGGNFTYTQSNAIQSFHSLVGSVAQSLVVTWTSALLTNFLGLSVIGCNVFLNPTITGNGAAVFMSGQTISIALADAAQQVSFGQTAGANFIGIAGGDNILTMTPTAARVLTINTPGGIERTRILVKNLSATFPIDLTLSGGTIQTGSPTYVPPLGQVEITYSAAGGSRWFVEPYVQSGFVTLTNGLSGNIPADITATSKITITWKTSNGAAGVPLVLTKVAGSRAGGGVFTFASAALATGVTVGTDQGGYEWHIAP